MLVTDHFFRRNLQIFDILLFIDAVVAIGIQIAHLKVPTIYYLGVSWNIHPATTLIISLTGFAYGIYWAWLFGRVAYILREKALKRRMYMLCANGILQGTAALFIFLNDVNMNFIGIMLIFSAAIISVFVFILPTALPRTNKDFVPA